MLAAKGLGFAFASTMGLCKNVSLPGERSFGERMADFNLLVVCTANVCRSPAAEIFLKEALAGKPVQVHSAGTLALDGNPADATIQALMSERGYEAIKQHRSRALMPRLLSKADLVLCMEQDHMARLKSLSPALVGKTRMMGHWEGQTEIDDPIGRSRQTYERSLDKMERLARLWAEKIQQMGLV
jgi:protein-tyrosine phosphatase